MVTLEDGRMGLSDNYLAVSLRWRNWGANRFEDVRIGGISGRWAGTRPVCCR